jgi:hypothetical protein
MPAANQLSQRAGDVCKRFAWTPRQVITVSHCKNVTPDLIRVSTICPIVVRILRTAHNRNIVERAIPGVFSLEAETLGQALDCLDLTAAKYTVLPAQGRSAMAT